MTKHRCTVASIVDTLFLKEENYLTKCTSRVFSRIADSLLCKKSSWIPAACECYRVQQLGGRSCTAGPESVRLCSRRGEKGGIEENPQWWLLYTPGWILLPIHAYPAKTRPAWLAFADTSSTQGRFLLHPVNWCKTCRHLLFVDFHWLPPTKSESVALFPRDFWSN